MSSDRRDDRKDREFRSRPNDTNRNDSKSIRCRVFVGNLATEELSRQEFEEIFAKHGRVIGCSVHNGYGFVQYEKESSADLAVAKEHGSTIKGKRVDVNLAGERRKPDAKRRPPPPAGRGRGRPGDRSRDRSPSPKSGRLDDPFSIPGYREARDRYRDEHADSDRHADPPYGRGHDEVPAKKLRPDYDFAPLSRDAIPPPVGKPVEAPIDCEIIIINKQQMAYAESVEKKLKLNGLVVECAHLPETVPLLDELDDASKRGVLFGIIISSQHEVHRSVTVHILHGTQQEHRNMPLEDAILLVSRNFDTYMQALRERELRPPLAADPLAPKKGYPSVPGAVSSVVPSPYTREVSTLLNIAADGRPLTVDEYTLVIDEFTKLRNDLLKKEGRVPPSSTGSAYPPYPNDSQSIAQQQAELQAKILSILNPSTKPATETKPKTTNETVTTPKPSIPVLTPSTSASTAFKAPAQITSQTSNIIGMALSSIRTGTTSQSGNLTQTPAPGSTTSYSGVGSYSAYTSPAGTSQSWSQARYRSPAPSPSQHRGPAPGSSQLRGPTPNSTQSARPTGSPGYPNQRYPAAGQMNSRGGYRASYPNSYQSQARY